MRKCKRKRGVAYVRYCPYPAVESVMLPSFLSVEDMKTTHPIYNFFKKIFGGHESFLWGHWCACFELLVTSHRSHINYLENDKISQVVCQ